MRAILQQAHEARIARLQSRWSRITVTWPTHAQPSHAHAATIAPAGAAVIPPAVADVSPCSVSLLTEERVGETVGSIVWEGCAALMVHLMAPSAAASAARSGDAAARSPLPLSDRLRGVRAIELGAGVGVLGCLAAKLGAQVCITDRREIMHVIQHNIEANQLQHQAQCVELEWGTKPEAMSGAPFDLIIASDVIYNLQAAWLLLETLEQLSDEHTEILIAYRERDQAEAAWFERAARSFTISTERVHPQWQHAITFQTVAQPPRQVASAAAPSFAAPTASSSSPPISAALKYQHEHRPLSILRLQKKKLHPQTSACVTSTASLISDAPQR